MLEANQPLDARSRDVMKDGWDHGFDAASHVRAMDQEGIDIAVLFRTVASMLVSLDEMEPSYSLSLCQAFNDWVAGYCQEAPARLKATAIVPQQDPVLAAGEARTSSARLGRGRHRPTAHADSWSPHQRSILRCAVARGSSSWVCRSAFMVHQAPPAATTLAYVWLASPVIAPSPTLRSFLWS